MAIQKSAGSAKKAAVDAVFKWKGVDRKGQPMQGELRATSEAAVREALRKQGIRPSAVSKQFFSMAQGIKPKEVALFTRQLSTMMKSGIPLLQSFEMTCIAIWWLLASRPVFWTPCSTGWRFTWKKPRPSKGRSNRR